MLRRTFLIALIATATSAIKIQDTAAGTVAAGDAAAAGTCAAGTCTTAVAGTVAAGDAAGTTTAADAAASWSGDSKDFNKAWNARWKQFALTTPPNSGYIKDVFYAAEPINSRIYDHLYDNWELAAADVASAVNAFLAMTPDPSKSETYADQNKDFDSAKFVGDIPSNVVTSSLLSS